ncbi:bile acid:sodium symporter family protein [Alkalicoccobacillus porphyridii]|uniref:Bile acid:sodium symporter family protein n=1 Tax=Alkalicoccobacillus porphyridii TaxID=2597270 RepID=A0A553ZUR0_9BACI|nr:bile acid:sodium symporter family protein [Alkalicoccobacillus porphyridii]TSB45228.1 bile acid:sodium symporter family protein [Alkalicoccobacillus porphyridii]
MLDTLNRFLERALPILTPMGVITGVMLSTFFSSYVFLVPFIFAFITFASSLAISPKDMKNIVHYPAPILTSMVIIQVIMPLLAFGLGHAFFAGNVETIAGLVLAFTIPTGVVTLMWVSIYNGSRSLTLAIILINTLISPFIVPLTLSILIGGQISLDTWGVMSGLIMMVILPSALGILVNHLRKGNIIRMSKTLAPLAKLSLLTVIMLNGSIVAPYLTSIDATVITIFFVVLTLAITSYLIGFFGSRRLGFASDISISVMFNSGMRNIGVGAAIAVVYFPPAVSLPVILGTLFQQVLAALFGKFISRKLQKEQPEMDPAVRME